MLYKYELACKEAGLSEEQTEEIRRFFDAEKKRLKRDKEAREEEGITFSYIVPSETESEVSGDLESRDIVDEDFDLEEIIMKKLLLEQLHKALAELPADDREFLYALYSRGYGAETALSREMKIPRQTLQRRKERLLKRLRSFFEKT